jgi:hypothetical protein
MKRKENGKNGAASELLAREPQTGERKKRTHVSTREPEKERKNRTHLTRECDGAASVTVGELVA